MATFCPYFFEWFLQYNKLLFIRELDNTNRFKLQLHNCDYMIVLVVVISQSSTVIN
jgi:hypothetical protein